MVFKGDSLKDYILDFKDDKLIKIELPNVKECKVGKWIKQYKAFVNDDNQIVTECHCSNCYGIAYFRSIGNKLAGANYCPVCGSFMDGEK